MKRIKKGDGIDKAKVLEFKQVAENCMDIDKAKILEFKMIVENSIDMAQDQGLALKLEFVYGDYIHNPEFVEYYLATTSDLFKLFPFERAYHPFFGMFLEGLPKLISIMGEDTD